MNFSILIPENTSTMLKKVQNPNIEGINEDLSLYL